MKVMIYSQVSNIAKELPEDKSGFYKELAKELTSLGACGRVDVCTPFGQADYMLNKRSGTLFITKTNDRIAFPVGTKEEYPTVYLTCVNEEYNNYKFYRLEQEGDEVVATYGRIGAAKGELFGERSYRYPLDMFWIKYYEKLAKGYIDKSDIYLQESQPEESPEETKEGSKEISKNPVSINLYERLLAFAKKKIEITCKSIEITQGMIEESNRLLALLYQTTDLESFNSVLKDLLAVCPRKVWKVDMLLAKSAKDIPAIVDREEDLVTAMKVLVPRKANKNAMQDKFLAENITVKTASEEQCKKVLNLLDASLRNKVVNVWRVNPKNQRTKFMKYIDEKNISEIKSLWHGSRNENWLSIVENGLLLNPNAQITGKMFGNGIYFAPKSTKSWNYTSARGAYYTHGASSAAFMGLYATAYGKPLDETRAHSYSEKSLGDKNCVHAHAGQSLLNDEIIYYNESAMVLTYLVEFAA